MSDAPPSHPPGESDDRLLAGLAHDLRTPLAVINTTAAMLGNPKYSLTPEQTREEHERIRRNVALMHRLLSDVTDVLALRAGTLTLERAALGLDEALRAAIAAQEPAARAKGLDLRFTPAGTALAVNADAARLAQLLAILLGAAIERGASGETVNLTCRARGDHAHIDISGRASGRPVNALGLALAQGIASAHGGELRVNAAPDAGIVFTVTLPRAP